MPGVSGETGSVDIANPWNTGMLANVFSWTVTASRETLDTTPFSPTGGWRTKVGSLSAWSGAFEAWLDDTVVPEPIVGDGTLDTAVATFITGGGDTYGGSIILTEVTAGVSVDGVDTLSASFDGLGALAIAAA